MKTGQNSHIYHYERSHSACIYGKHIKREIAFFILCGSCGDQFLQSIINIQQAGEIYEINSWIKENFRNSFTVEELAEKRNMSVSLFHQKFKNAAEIWTIKKIFGFPFLSCSNQVSHPIFHC